MSIPSVDTDLFSDDTLTNTPSAYQSLRDNGPLVHLSANDLYAVTHFDAVRAALRADTALISSHGVAANDFLNSTQGYATITSDGEVHSRRRSVLMRPLMPGSLKEVATRINTAADQLVETLLDRDEFCGVADFARVLPVSIVSELVGLEEPGRENMLEWAAATFNALGPPNQRMTDALETAMGLIQYIQNLTPDRLKPGGWAAGLFEEIDQGGLSPEEGAMMVVDYVAPSLDTTILATSHMLWELGRSPEQFNRLKDNPALISSMVSESVRLASPIRSFTRFCIKDYATDHGTIPEGTRVAILYASANWDERHYPAPLAFQVDRNPRDQVGWGHGVHLCAGKHLARMEMEALARALIEKVSVIEVDEPTRILNNLLQGFDALPTKLTT